MDTFLRVRKCMIAKVEGDRLGWTVEVDVWSCLRSNNVGGRGHMPGHPRTVLGFFRVCATDHPSRSAVMSSSHTNIEIRQKLLVRVLDAVATEAT